jgi:hypothetical protein
MVAIDMMYLIFRSKFPTQFMFNHQSVYRLPVIFRTGLALATQAHIVAIAFLATEVIV